MNGKKIAGSIAFYAGLTALWQLLYKAATDWFSLAKSYAIPYPAGVWKSFSSLLSEGTLLTAIGSSMVRVDWIRLPASLVFYSVLLSFTPNIWNAI